MLHTQLIRQKCATKCCIKTRQGRTKTKTNSAWRRRTKTKSNVDGQGGERPRQRLAGAAVLGSLLLVGSDYVGDVGEGVFSLLEMLRLNYNRKLVCLTKYYVEAIL